MVGDSKFQSQLNVHIISGTRRVHCNIIYNEYIQNKEHIHMNATRVSVVLAKSNT